MIVDIPFKELAGLLKAKASLETVVNKLSMFGTPVEEFDRDTIKLEVFPNRVDMLSAEGVARALNGFLEAELGYPVWNIRSSKVEVRIKRSANRPFVGFSEVRGSRLTPESLKGIMAMQEKLHETVGRDRRKYSIGLYDLDKIRPPITYEEVPLKEIEFTPLEEASPMTGEEILQSTEKGAKYAHLLRGKTAPVLRDAAGMILSMVPIINSEDCKVTPSTTNFFIDSTGTAPGPEDMVALMATNLAERGGSLGIILPGPSYLPTRLRVDPGYINRITGLSLDEQALRKLLNRMRIGYDGDALVPPYRLDVFGPIDIAEEVAIAHGYENFEGELAPADKPGEHHPSKPLEAEIRKLFAGFGFLELNTVMLTSPEILSLSGKHVLEVNNPKNLNYSALRQSLLPLLFDVLVANKKSEYPQRVFESGKVFLPQEELHVAGLIAHSNANFAEVKGIVDKFLRIAGKDSSWSPGEHPFFMKGRTAVSDLGVYGEVSPAISEKIGMPLAAFEINLERIL